MLSDSHQASLVLSKPSPSQWVVDGFPLTPYSDHRRLDMRSLAMHTLIARKIVRNPELLDLARRCV